MSAKTTTVEVLAISVPARDADGTLIRPAQGAIVEILSEDVDRLVELGSVVVVTKGGKPKGDVDPAVKSAADAAGEALAVAAADEANAAADVAARVAAENATIITVDTAGLDKAGLVAALRERGVNADKRWSEDRLRTELETAVNG